MRGNKTTIYNTIRYHSNTPQDELTNGTYTFKILYIPNGEYLNFNTYVYGLHYFQSNSHETKRGIYCCLMFIVGMMNEKPSKYGHFRKINKLPENHIFSISEFEVIYD